MSNVMKRGIALLVAIAGCFLLPFHATSAEQTAEPASAPTYDESLYGGGDGKSRETAVILTSRSKSHSVSLEYAWFRHHYRDWRPIHQALTPWQNGKRFDLIIIQAPDGREIMLWFDISATYK